VPSSSRRYTVRAGDTLNRIASRFGTTVKAIEAANGIVDPSRLQIGQVLEIP
jgi:LysM repeat protein